MVAHGKNISINKCTRVRGREGENEKKLGYTGESKSIFVWLTVRYDTRNENVHKLSVSVSLGKTHETQLNNPNSAYLLSP